jgi:competence ComEA-like helix-hairpin-helix protein
MKWLRERFTPDEQAILLFVVGCMVFGFILRGFQAEKPVTIAAASNAPLTIDLRTATTSDLESLPGIGPRLAERIVEYRTRHGFTATAQLHEVQGIGDRLYYDLQPYLTDFGVADAQPRSLNINSASAEELASVPGLNREQVRRILLARRAGVVFHHPADLKRIKGFGDKTIQTITPYLEWENDHE